ncbi:MAG: heparinase II/III family protein [Niabella sp.]
MEADKLLQASAIKPPNNLDKSREHVYRIITLATAYRILDDEKYAQEVEKLLVNLCNFDSWHPGHFLDVAETTTAVAIGYDWLYHFLSAETRSLIEKSITEKALNLAIPVYKEKGNPGSWAKRETNWNVVCNTGMTLGALAIAENNPVFVQEIIQYAANYVPNCLKHYAPHGVCYEGPGYWEYSNVYLALLLKSLNDNIGRDLGLSDLPGVRDAARYYVQSLSPTGKVFNFANSSVIASSASPLFFYFGNQFSQPEVIDYYRNKLTDLVNKKTPARWHFFLSVAWYQNSTKSEQAVFPPLQVFENDLNPILVFNGKRSVKESVYLAAKGGDPDEAHQQLDVGSFVIESEGIRWADDLGTDSYSLPGFWEYKPDGRRWHYFRNTNFSHNTLSIDNKLQYSGGKGMLFRYQTNAEAPFGIIDMSTVYKDQAKSVQRGFRFLDNRVMLIEDQIVPLSDNQSVCWSLITQANVEIDGKKAVLKKSGKTFYIKVISPHDVELNVEEAKTFSSIEKPLSGYKLLKITVCSKELKDNPIRVLAGNDLALIEQLSLNAYKSLSLW